MAFFARKILSWYRAVQYKVYNRSTTAAMSPGVLCDVDPFEEDINHGDVVHPCVRFIEGGYEGHEWWMVYTPYYGSDSSVENPILCYSDNDASNPPVHWTFYCQVRPRPSEGYNSDPTLLYSDGSLYVFWRECGTKACGDYELPRATFGGVVKDGKVVDIFGPVVYSDDPEHDRETCPTFIRDCDGNFRCLAMDLLFHSKKIKSLPHVLRDAVAGITKYMDILGLWSQQKSYGIAEWKSGCIRTMFEYEGTVPFKNLNALYRPWHMDFFEFGGELYSIVQTNQSNADICLAKSSDGVHYSFFPKPLMTNRTCGKVGIYKPTAGVAGSRFFLYYTAQDPDNRLLNRLYLTEDNFQSLLEKLA